MQQEAVDK
jgi:hypothetical protein